jgi:hypothetical protein
LLAFIRGSAHSRRISYGPFRYGFNKKKERKKKQTERKQNIKLVRWERAKKNITPSGEVKGDKEDN